MIRVLLTDDHPIVRDGLRGAFTGCADIEVIGEAATGVEALAFVAHHRPDVVLMDLRMPELDGVGAIRRLAAEHPAVRVLVLTTYDSEADVLPAIEAGATGYLLKDAPVADLQHAVRSAARGESVLAPSVAARLMAPLRRPAPGALTSRELDVLRLVAEGATNRAAANQLFISEASIKTHLLHAYAKLGVNDRAAAVGEAYRRGLL
ncbi:response regulator transcription factor [Amycolatopsis rhabdoformis]|uniref:Response regulator transcription factor n=1 Tax=Amycolatopsis rhabdoformis TaxID=1448059 RepID=A0ABZ1I686_9PSEU|nr:response regulator transcription factor [Amycolatopsis rhabdoformis]WSE29358.1 response regulator transcription factor [Amycolatopsis rhabdoformis]